MSSTSLTYQEKLRLFRIKQTQIKMIRARGYHISEAEISYLDADPDDFITLISEAADDQGLSYRQMLSNVYTVEGAGRAGEDDEDEDEDEDDTGRGGRDGDRGRRGRRDRGRGGRGAVNPSDKLLVKYIDVVNSIKADDIFTMTKDMDSHRAINGIIISPGKIRSDTAKRLVSYRPKYIQAFMEDKLMYDITESVIVPAHTALTEAELDEFVRTNDGIDIRNLPILLSSDPVSKYYDFRPGQVVRVERVNMYPTSVGVSLAYRIVMEE